MTYVRLHDNFQRIENKLKQLRNWFEDKGLKTNNLQIPDQQIKIDFTGHHTDIVNITRYENGRMPCSELDKLDDSVREKTRKEYDIAQQEGYIQQVNIDGVDYYELTEKGKNTFNLRNFLRATKRTRLKPLQIATKT